MTCVFSRRGNPSVLVHDLSKAFRPQPRDQFPLLRRHRTVHLLALVSRGVPSWKQRWSSIGGKRNSDDSVGNISLLRTLTNRSPLLGRFSWNQFRALSVQKDNQSPPKKPALASRLRALTPHEKIWNVPNILTFSRLFAAPLIGYLVLHDYHAWALGLFAYAGITDLVDGWVARKWNLQTVVGTVIDPMADKMLMTILTVCLAVKGALPLYLATIILGRDVLLAISAIYYRYISLPPPKTFTRYWDFTLPSAEVRPTTISKFNTALQLGLIGTTVGMPLLEASYFAGAWLDSGMIGFQYLVATTTVWSGASYVYNKDAVKILNQEGRGEKQKDL